MSSSVARLIPCLCLMAVPLLAQGKRDLKSDQAALRATFAKAIEAHHTGNPDLWLETVSDEVVIMLPGDTAIKGKASAERTIRQFFETTSSDLQPNIVEMNVHGDVAIVRTEDRGTFTPKAGGAPIPVNMKELLVFRRQKNGSWKGAYVAVIPNAGAPVLPATASATTPTLVYASASTAKFSAVPDTRITSASLFGDSNADEPNGEFISFPPNFDAGGWHVHTNTMNIVGIKGAYLYRDENGEKRIGAGDFLRIPGGHRHWSGTDPKDGAVFYAHMDARMDQKPAP